MIQKVLILAVATVLVAGSAQSDLSPTGPDIEKVACKYIPPAQDFIADLTLLGIPDLYIVPLASLSNVRVYAATFLGRLAKDQAEIDRMCMNILFTGIVATQTGYVNNTYINLAIPTDPVGGAGIFDFSTQVAHTPQVNTSYQATSIETIPLANGKDWAMLVRCINDDFLDWKVASKRPLNATEKAKVLSKAQELGFNTTYYYDRDSTASNFTCPGPSTVPEAAAQTLINFKVFSNDSPLVQLLNPALQVLGTSYNRLVSMYNSVITPHVTALVDLMLKCCVPDGLVGQLPIACLLLT